MAKILDKKLVSPAVYELVIEAPLIARKCKPGQFVIVLSDPESERVPFTIADFDREKGTITLIIQVVGNTSRHICEDFEAGDEWDNIVGPLGQPSEMKHFGTVVCVGGGIGVAPVYPIARAYKELGNRTIWIYKVFLCRKEWINNPNGNPIFLFRMLYTNKEIKRQWIIYYRR